MAPSNAEPRGRPIRVAVIGGGCAGITAAWHLAQQRGYEVHVFEKSWRLGGKGASGRDEQGRIREHGLHVWLGFYENAFRMMRDCYAEVEAQKWAPEREKPEYRLAHSSIDDAFLPEPHIGVAGYDTANTFNVWSGFLPPAKGLPGDPLDAESNPFTLANYLLRCFSLLKALMLSVIESPAEDAPGPPRPDARSTSDEAIDLDFSFDPTRSPAVLIERVARLLRGGALTTAAGLLQAVTILENWLHKLNYSPQVADSALQLMEAVAAQVRKQLRDLVAVDPKVRWKTEIIDIVMTIAVGLYRDRVLFDERGLDAINDLDYRDWLKQHGATKTSLDSRFILGIYDLVFAYEKGDKRQPALAAGVALRGALRMFFTYRGSMFWRLRSGMGDAVFAPLYKVLLLDKREVKTRYGKTKRVRPVKFHFLHALTSIDMDFEPNRRRVTRLTFALGGDEAVRTRLSTNALDHFGCWPAASPVPSTSAPSPSTTTTRAAETLAWDVDKDFDAVIFAMGVDNFTAVCAQKNELDEDTTPFFEKMPPEWNQMRVHTDTVATQAAQVWLDRDLEALGWYRGSGVITALDMQFDTWADMTHTLATEKAWRDAANVPPPTGEARSVAYFCGVVPDKPAQSGRTTARQNLDALLTKTIAPLWPAAFGNGKTAQSFKVGCHAQDNVVGSERYTLSLPGSIEHRISPLDRPVLNMSVAGDWTACGLDAGCVEAAVMSGMLAAHAISNDEPSIQSIVGYDHP